MLAEHFNGLHNILVADGLGGHQELELVHAGRLMDLDGFNAAIGVPGNDYGPFGHSVGVELLPDALGQCGPTRQIETC